MDKLQLKTEIASQLEAFGNKDQDAIDYTFELITLIDDMVGIEYLQLGYNTSKDPNDLQSNITIIRTAKDSEEYNLNELMGIIENHDMADGILDIIQINENTIAIDCIY